jgi:predicted dehydrogenase
MDRKVNWGVLGCAGIAEKAFIPAVRESRNGVLAGIAARDEARAKAWADRFGFLKSHRTYQELVEDPRIDAIYNPLPNDLHAEWSIRAMRAGKHVLCEKPMAMNALEVRAMIEAAESGGVLLMEGFMYKFHPQIEKTLARFVLGAEPVSVFARARVDPATGVDMTTAAVLEFPGGRFAQCDSSFESHFQSRLLAVGSEGTLRLDRAFSAKDFDTAIEIIKGDKTESIRVPQADMFILMAEHFGDAVLEKTPLRYPAGDALDNMQVIDAWLESIRTGRAVEIPNTIHQGGVLS